MNHLVSVLVLAAGAQASGNGTLDTASLAGEYASVSSNAHHCELSISPTARFTQLCGQLAKRGSVTLTGNIISLQPNAVAGDAVIQWFGEYQRAAEAYRQKQFKDYGFYPLLVPPPPPGMDKAAGAMAAVVFKRHLYLVDLFQRDAFCTEAKAGLDPHGTSSEHLLFRSREQSDSFQAASWEVFCSPDWKVHLEIVP